MASATASLGHFWKAQVGQFWRAPKDRRVGGIADLDGDGRPDLVTAVFGRTPSVTILLNRIEQAPRALSPARD